MDRMGLQANNDVVNRLYSMTILQAGSFDNLYDNEGGFRGMIRALLGHVQENSGGPFSGLVTPDNTRDAVAAEEETPVEAEVEGETPEETEP